MTQTFLFDVLHPGRWGGRPSSRWLLGRVTQLVLLYLGRSLLGLLFPSFCFQSACDLESHVFNIQSYPTSFPPRAKKNRQSPRQLLGLRGREGGQAALTHVCAAVCPDPFPLPGPLAQTLILFLVSQSFCFCVRISTGQGSCNRENK